MSDENQRHLETLADFLKEIDADADYERQKGIPVWPPTQERMNALTWAIAEIARLRADVERLRKQTGVHQEALIECERATWLEWQTVDHLAVKIRRIIQRCLEATEPKP